MTLALTGKSKEAIGTDLSVESLKKMSEKEIEKYFNSTKAT